MLEYANTYWPAPNGPLLGSSTAYSYNNPRQTIDEHFGLVRGDYNISSNDTLALHYTNDTGSGRVRLPSMIRCVAGH